MMKRCITCISTLAFSLLILGVSGVQDAATAGSAQKDAAVRKDEKVVAPKSGEAKISQKMASKLKKLAKKAKLKVAKKKSASKKKKSAAKKKSASKKRSRRSRSTHVARLGRFKGNGDIASFKAAADRVADFIKTKLTPKTPKAQKYDAYKCVGTMVKMTGRPRFDTDAHYQVTKGLLDTAVANVAKFKMRAIERGLKNHQTQFTKEMNSPDLRTIKKLKFAEKQSKREAKRSAKRSARTPKEKAKIAQARKDRKAAKKEAKAKRAEKAKSKQKAKSKGKSKGKSKNAAPKVDGKKVEASHEDAKQPVAAAA